MSDSINEDDLHAYVDGALSEMRRLEVEAWLAAHPDDAARVQSWVEQNRSLHSAFDSVLNEPLPIDLVRVMRRGAPPRAAYKAVAAGIALAASGLVGYGIGVVSAPRAMPDAPLAAIQLKPLAREAAMAHAVFSPETRHPVEVEAVHADHLVKWLSRRLGTELQAPDFTSKGFSLLGGRLLPGDTGPVAQFMYQDDMGRRVTLYVRRDAADNDATQFRHATENGVEVFYWIDRDFGYALSGQIAPGDIRALATAAYTQLAVHSGPP